MYVNRTDKVKCEKFNEFITVECCSFELLNAQYYSSHVASFYFIFYFYITINEI